LAALGAEAGLGELNGIVRAVALRLPNPAFVDDPGQKRRLADAFLIDVALELATLGFNAGDVRATSGDGAALVSAAAARVRGTANLNQYSLLSDTFIIGRVTGVNTKDDRGDGYLSTVTFSVVRSFSKDLTANDVVELRRLSGESGTKRVGSSTEEPLALGDQVLLVGSRAHYRNSTRAGGKRKTAVELIPFYRVNGDTLSPSSPYQQPASLNDLVAN
jgi:hypothetical protein